MPLRVITIFVHLLGFSYGVTDSPKNVTVFRLLSEGELSEQRVSDMKAVRFTSLFWQGVIQM